MELAPLDLPAIVVAAALSFVIGGLWYSPMLFGGPWLREAGLSEEQTRAAPMARVFGLSAVASLVMAFTLAAFIGARSGVAFGLLAGAAVGVGWVAMSLGVIYLFEQRSVRLWLINSGYQVVSYTVMGGILGAWK